MSGSGKVKRIMTMKKTLTTVAALLALGALADDSYLYWMVGDTTTLDGTTLSQDGLYAKVMAYDTTTWTYWTEGKPLALYTTDGTGSAIEDGVKLKGDNGPNFAAISAAFSGSEWAYFIELYNSDGFVGRSTDGLDINSAQAGDYLAKTVTATPGSLWTVAAFTSTPVPEPTSGLLLLAGGALLALRRRRLTRQER